MLINAIVSVKDANSPSISKRKPIFLICVLVNKYYMNIKIAAIDQKAKNGVQ